MKPTNIHEKAAYEKGVMDFVDHIMPTLTLEAQLELCKAYQAWNRRAGGQLEGKPLQGVAA